MYNKKLLSKAISELGKAKAPSKPKDIIKDPRGQWAYPGQNTRIPGGDITMDNVPYPVWAQPNVGPGMMMQPGQDYNFPGADYVDEFPQMQSGGHTVKQRRGTKENYDGHSVWTPSGQFSRPSDVSSHLMKAEYVDGRGWVAFPSLFQDSKPYADDQENWKEVSEKDGWWPIYQEAERRGEVYDFGEDKEAALAFGMGSWKDQLPSQLQDKQIGGENRFLPKAQRGVSPIEVTRQDSLDLYNNAMQVQAFYDKNKNFYDVDISPGWHKDNATMKEIEAETMGHDDLSYDNTKIIERNNDPNISYTSDMITGAIDTNAPLLRYDHRIKPEGEISYSPKNMFGSFKLSKTENELYDKLVNSLWDAAAGSYRMQNETDERNHMLFKSFTRTSLNFDKKDLITYAKSQGFTEKDMKVLLYRKLKQNEINKNTPGLHTRLPYYNPTSIKPWDMKTEKEKELTRNKTSSSSSSSGRALGTIIQPKKSYEAAYKNVDKEKYPTIDAFIADAEYYKKNGRNMTDQERADAVAISTERPIGNVEPIASPEVSIEDIPVSKPAPIKKKSTPGTVKPPATTLEWVKEPVIGWVQRERAVKPEDLKEYNLSTGSYLQEGGQNNNYIELDLDENEIQAYRDGGYIVEDLPQAQNGTTLSLGPQYNSDEYSLMGNLGLEHEFRGTKDRSNIHTLSGDVYGGNFGFGAKAGYEFGTEQRGSWPAKNFMKQNIGLDPVRGGYYDLSAGHKIHAIKNRQHELNITPYGGMNAQTKAHASATQVVGEDRKEAQLGLNYGIKADYKRKLKNDSILKLNAGVMFNPVLGKKTDIESNNSENLGFRPTFTLGASLGLPVDKRSRQRAEIKRRIKQDKELDSVPSIASISNPKFLEQGGTTQFNGKINDEVELTYEEVKALEKQGYVFEKI